MAQQKNRRSKPIASRFAREAISVIYLGGVRRVSVKALDAKAIGAKAAGLLTLPSEWIPEFFVIAPEIADRYRRLVTIGRRDLAQSLLKRIASFAQSHLADGGWGEDPYLLIRSSALSEHLGMRGRYHSSTEQLSKLKDGLDVVLRHWIKTETEERASLAIIVQKKIIEVATGHLSNERRLVRDFREWFVQAADAKGGVPSIHRIATRNEPYDESRPIRCTSALRVHKVLRGPAQFSVDHASPTRTHFEWVWDGTYVWLVQADLSTPQLGMNPFLVVAPGKRRALLKKPRVLRPLAPESPWPFRKANNVHDYWRLGLPVGRLFILHGAKEITSLSKGKLPAGLSADLKDLMRGGDVVIRSDIRALDRKLLEQQMLPRSDGCRTIRAAADFLISTTKAVLKENPGLFCDSLAFLVHVFIPSRASAWCTVAPSGHRARIEALWGIPEGMDFLPHDSFEVALDSKGKAQGVISAKARQKASCLWPQPNGKWTKQAVAEPYDWRPCVSEMALRRVAEGSLALANSLGESVNVMWFLDCVVDTDWVEVLPWYHENARKIAPRSAAPLIYTVFPVVRSMDDMNNVILGEDQKHRMVDLDPEVQHLRDKVFLQKLADWAKRNSVSVRMRGSLLSHAYYQLESAGVSVICVDPLEGEVETAEFNKLVRDEVPRSIQERGEGARIRKLVGRELETALRSKLVEEAIEVSRASNYEELVGEIADLQEVLIAIKKHIAVSGKDVRDEQRKKRRRRGGFSSGLMLLRTESQPIIQSMDPNPQRSLLPESGSPPTLLQRDRTREGAASQIIPFVNADSYFTVTVGGQQLRVRAALAAHGIELELVPTETADQLGLFSDKKP